MVKLGTYGGINIENEYWFVNISFNGLFAYHYETGKIRWIHKFKHVKVNEKYSYGFKILKQGDTLFFFPISAEDVIVYNIRTNEETVIKLDGLGNIKNGYLLTEVLQKRKEKVVLFPMDFNNGIYQVDLLTLKAELCTQWNCYVKDNNLLAAEGTIIDETKDFIWMGFRRTNLILKMDKDLNILSEYRVPVQDLKIHFLKYIKDRIWIIQMYSTDICCWNPETNEIRKYSYFDKNTMEGRKEPFEKIAECGSDILLINGLVPYNMRIQSQKDVIDDIIEYPKGCIPIEYSVYDMEKYQELYYFFPRRCKQLLIYDPNNHKFEGKSFEIEEKDIPYYNELVEAEFMEEILYEGDTAVSLKGILDFLKGRN